VKIKTLLTADKDPAQTPVEEMIACLNFILPMMQMFYWNATSSEEKEILGDLHCVLQGELDCLAEQYVLHCGPITPPRAYEEYESVREMIAKVRDQAFYATCDNKSIMKAIDSIYNTIMHAKYKLEVINTNQE
jgi:hypothetical protein